MIEKINQAKQRIKEYIFNVDKIFVGHSGGKDSVAVHNLTLEVLNEMGMDNNLTIVHNPKKIFDKSKHNSAGTTDVYYETLEFLYGTVSKYANITIVNPLNMKEFIRSKNLTMQIDGTRADENERISKSSNLVLNGEEQNRGYMSSYNPRGLYDLEFLYPIFDWNTNDVFTYLEMRDIKISPEYLNDTEYKTFKGLQ